MNRVNVKNTLENNLPPDLFERIKNNQAQVSTQR